MTDKKKILAKLFFSTLYLSAFTFGGGYVIVTLMKQKFVDELHWIQEDEMLDLIAIAQSAPGAIAVNGAIVVGFKLAGVLGAITAIIATIIPPFLIITVISFFYELFRDNYIVSNVLSGMQAGVGAVIASVVIDMGGGVLKQKSVISAVIMLTAFAATYVFRINVVYVILSCIVIGVAVTLVVTILATIFMHPLLRLLKTPAEILEESYSYISILSIFLFVMFAYNLCSGLLRAIGNSFMPLVFLIFSSLVNIVLDLLFIRTFGMGVRGAAIATVIAQGISVVLCLIYIVTKAKILLPEKRHFEPDRGLYMELLAQGFSMGFMSSIIYVGSIVLQPGINSLGYETIAGHTAARKLFSFSMMPLSSMAQAVNTYVAQNRGADNWERVRKGIRYAYIFCFSVTACLILLVTPLAPTMVHLISGSSDPTVLGNGARYLRVAIPFFFALGLVNCSRLALQALGEKILPLLSSFIELFGKIIFAMVFIPRYHYSAVIWCEPIIWCFMAAELVISLYRNPYMRKGKSGN